MTLETFKKFYIDGYLEFAYKDDSYDIGMFYGTDDGKVVCYSNQEEVTIVSDMAKALDEFVVNGKTLREILPELDEKLI